METSSSAPPSPPPHALATRRLSHLLHQMNKTAQTPSAAADLFDQIRHLLPDLPHAYDATLIAQTAVRFIRQDPSNLLLAHRAVAVLAHPSLCAASVPVERAVVTAMDRLNMSAAFQHTAMAALQNAASPNSAERDTVVLAVVSAMRQHHTQNGILLRAADLIAFHLNQQNSSPLTSTYRVASRIVVDTSAKLTATPQGASTALLALVAAARHARSVASFSGRPSSTTRFSRGTSASAIVDAQFAAAVVAAMSRHIAYAPVQALACDVIRVSAAGSATVSRQAAKELHAAGAPNAVLAALQTHPTDLSVVDLALVALRALFLGGASHGRSIKPSLNISHDLIDYAARVADSAADSIAVKDRDLSSAAAVLAMDIRAALVTISPRHRQPSTDPSRLTGLGRRIMRRIRFGQKQNWYDQEYERFAEENLQKHDAARKDAVRVRRIPGRSSFSIVHTSNPYKLGTASQDVDAAAKPANVTRTDGGGVKANRKMSEGTVLTEPAEGAQIALSKKWRSVSGRWNQRGRRGSTVSTSIDAARTGASTNVSNTNGRRERRGPLTLSGSEMANLTRQPSRIFGSQPGGDPFSLKADPRMGDKRPAFVSGGHEDFGF